MHEGFFLDEGFGDKKNSLAHLHSQNYFTILLFEDENSQNKITP
jgi:hypothetical protein